MKSKAASSFWEMYGKLPVKVQNSADKQFSLWLSNPSHPSVRFKKVGAYWSARVANSYRAVGILDGDTVVCSSLAHTLSMIGP